MRPVRLLLTFCTAVVYCNGAVRQWNEGTKWNDVKLVHCVEYMHSTYDIQWKMKYWNRCVQTF